MVRVVRERTVLYVIFLGGYVLSDAEEGGSFPGDGVVLFPSDSKEDVVEGDKISGNFRRAFSVPFLSLSIGPEGENRGKKTYLAFSPIITYSICLYKN